MDDSSKKWYFTKEQLENTPSKHCGIDPYKELSYRQQAANFIQAMGQRLKVNQLCISTATVYMHRFYVFHSFTHFAWESIAAAALFIAAKVVEQPRKLEHIIWAANFCKNSHNTACDVTSERYRAQSQDLAFNEIVLLQTLGFNVTIEQPHKHILLHCQRVGTSKDLTDAFCVIASKCLRLTTMCLQYKPTVVACFCIYFVCKWFNWEIPVGNENKDWFSYVDETVTPELLEQLTKEYLLIYERYQSRLKEKIGDGPATANSGQSTSHFELSKKLGPFPLSEQKDQKSLLVDGKIEQHFRLSQEPGVSGQCDYERLKIVSKSQDLNGWCIKQNVCANGISSDVSKKSETASNSKSLSADSNLPCDNLKSDINQHLSAALIDRNSFLVKRPIPFSPVHKMPSTKNAPNFLTKPIVIPFEAPPTKSDLRPSVDIQNLQVKPDLVACSTTSCSNNNITPLYRPMMYSIETNPSIISKLLKDIPQLPGVARITDVCEPKDKKRKEHKKDKKKRKHAHGDEKRHKKRKNKEQVESWGVSMQPIKITIAKDRIQPKDTIQSIEWSPSSLGIKLKIPRQRLTNGSHEFPTAGDQLKINIAKEVETCNSLDPNHRQQ